MNTYILLTACVCLAYAEIQLYDDISKAPEMFVNYIEDYDKHFENIYDLLKHYEAYKEKVFVINKIDKERASDSQLYPLNGFVDYTRQDIKKLFPGFEYKHSDIYVSEDRPISTLEQNTNDGDNSLPNVKNDRSLKSQLFMRANTNFEQF